MLDALGLGKMSPLMLAVTAITSIALFAAILGFFWLIIRILWHGIPLLLSDIWRDLMRMITDDKETARRMFLGFGIVAALAAGIALLRLLG